MKKKLNPSFGCRSALVRAMSLWLGLASSALAQMAAPEPLVITGVTANTVGLAWNDIYDNEDGFRLTRSDGLNQVTFQLGPGMTNYLDTGLTTGTTYYYQVVAFNSDGESFPATAAVTPTPIPAPEPLVITSITANTVGLAWNDIYDNEDGFLLIRSDGLNQTTFQFGPGVTNYLDTNLVTGVTYYYQVFAFNSGGQSFPATASATPSPIPAPEPLVVTSVTANTVGLAWNDIYDNEDGFLLTRSDGLNQAIFQFGPGVTNYLDTGLTTDTTYYYQVVAFNSGGESFPATASATPSPIPPPEPLVITGVTANTIGLAWNDIYDSEDGFLLTRSDGLNQATFQFGPGVTTYLDTNLITGVWYYYQVVAFNSGGQSYAAFASAVPDPIAPPEPLVITGVTANTIGLVWNDIYDNEDGFLLTRSDGVNQTTFQFGPGVTNYLDTNLVTGVWYYYQVVSFNSGGQSYAAFASAVPDPIAPPEPLVITGVTANTIGLAWNDIYDNEDGFLLTRSDGVNQTTFQFGPGVTNYLDTNLVTDVWYYYEVVAFNSGGQSYAAFASALPTPIPAPEPLVVTVVSGNTISLAWNDLYEDEDGFLLTRWDKLGNQAIFQLGPNVVSYADTNLAPGTLYNYQVVALIFGGVSAAAFNSATTTPLPGPDPLLVTDVTSNTIALAWSDIYTNEDGFRFERSTNNVNFYQVTLLNPNTTNYTDSGLRWGTTYYYRVAAFNSGGDSSYATTNARTRPYPPAAPSGLVASVVSFDRVDLSWTDNAANETAFLIERSTNGVSFVQIARLGPNVTAFSDTGLTASTTYYYRVRATDSGWNSAYSNTAFATTGLAVPPAAPSDLGLAVVSSTQIDLQWKDNSSNETQFVIELSLNKNSFTPIGLAPPNAQNYSATGLQPNTHYYFRVRAINSAGDSAYSNTNNAKTLH